MAKFLKKSVGIVLAFCVFALLFTCVTGGGLLSAAGATSDLVSFDGTNPWGCFMYTTSWRTVYAGNYRFEMDCIITSGTPVAYPFARYNASEYNANFTNRQYSYDAINHKYTVTFTVTETYEENLSFIVGNYGGGYGGSGDAVFACANPVLYLLDGSGEATDGSLLNTFASSYYSSESDVNTASVNKWRRRNDGWTCSQIPSGYFDPEPATEQTVHFPAGYDNYQVLVYKGGSIAAGTYRFTVDEYDAGGIKSYVNLWVNADYQTAVTRGADVLSGNKRTVEFTLYNSKDSFLIMIGNFGLGTAMDTYYKNPALHKIENGQETGVSLIDAFTDRNVVFRTVGDRSSAESGKWTTLNWAEGYIVFDGINDTPKMLKLGGYGAGMQALSVEKKLEAGATYQFDMDYRANGGVAALKSVEAAVAGSSTTQLNNSNTVSRTDTGTHLSVRFILSDSAAGNNFRIYIGQSWPQKRNGTVYFANLTLRKVENGQPGNVNLFYNGDFHKGDAGVVDMSAAVNVFSGWQQKNVMSYTSVELLEIPDGFFEDETNLDCDKVYKFKGGDTYKPQFNFQFSAGTKYRLIYDYYCDSDDTVNAYVISKDNSLSAAKVSRTANGRFEAVYDIESAAGANEYTDSKYPNGSIRFALNGNSYDSEFCISNIRLYKMSGDQITGANLVYNLNPILDDSVYGLSEIGDKTQFELAKDDSRIDSQKTDIGISWVGNLNYNSENVGTYSYVLKTNGHMFDYYDYSDTLPFMRNALIGKNTGYNPCTDSGSRFYDPNKDETVDVCDLVRLKKNRVNDVDMFDVQNEQTNGGIYPAFDTVTCYGDSITQGMSYTAEQAYPGRLQSMLGSGYTVINSGDPGETSETIMARQGALSLVTSKSMTFPAGTAKITIGDQDDNGFVSPNGDHIGLTGLLGNENKLNNVTINGNQYKVSLADFVWSPRSYTVNLERIGSTSSAITVPGGTKVIFNNTTRQNECEIYLVGANDSDKSADLLVSKYKAMVDNHGSNNFLIVVPYFGGSCKTEFLNAFGDHCVDFRSIAYTDEAFAYEGLTKTSKDIEMINQSRLPTSFRRNNDENEVHLNEYGYDLLAHLLYEQGKTLGYF